MFKRILLAVDDGKDASGAIRAAKALARAFSSDVTVLHVRERRVTSAAVIEKETIPESFAYGETVAASLAEDGIRASAVIVAAEPQHLATRILAHAEEVGAELIVIGGHPPRSIRERLFGDIGRALAQQARFPVLLVPAETGGQ
jgi:nucleotide-binding universal stress UspA family protein